MGLDRDLALRGGTKTQTEGQIQETLQEKKKKKMLVNDWIQ